MTTRRPVLLGALLAMGLVGVGAVWAGADDGDGDGGLAADPPPRTTGPADPADDTTDDTTGPDLPDRGPHPALEQIDGWLQSDVTSLEELRGRVVAVQFWTFGCHNCRATLPHLRALRDAHAGDDFEIVGVHSPELDHEEDPDAIATAAADLGVTWPIALDTSKRTFFGWQGGRGYWPHIYLLDREGHVRYDHIGEGRYEEIDAAVTALLAEPGGAPDRRDPG